MHFIMILISASLFAAILGVAGYQLKDASLKIARALPASTAAVTSNTSFDFGGVTALATKVEQVEVLLTAPALTMAQLPDTKTMTYKIIHSDNADLSSPVDLFPSLIIQTGAGGVGAAGAAKAVFKVPSDSKRYLGLVITPSASGTGDASGVSGTLEQAF